MIEKSLEQWPFFMCLRETTSSDLSKGSLEAIPIHLLWILCVLGTGNSVIRCFNQELSDFLHMKRLVTSVS